MQTPIDSLLAARGLLVLDGALATEFERRGADLADPLWSAKLLIEQPAMIRAVHLDYFKAGADVAITATYQATFEGFARRGLTQGSAARLMRDAVALAVAARDEYCAAPGNDDARPLVAASVGPYGAMLADGSEYRGRYRISDDELANFHRPRLEVLADAGADVLAFETLPCLREALILAQLLEEFPAMSAWVSFSCCDGGRNCEGEDIGECAAALAAFEQVRAVGVNCTPPEHVASLLDRMRGRTLKPLVAYPNSGERYDPAARAWCASPSYVGSFADASRAWVAAGARIIGGCCRTTPADIRALSAQYPRALRKLSEARRGTAADEAR
jgi:homocysteine S-methyltransferase